MKNTSYYLFLFALIFAPLAFGTVEHWSLMVLELSIVLAFGFYFFSAWVSKESLVRVVGIIPLTLLLIYIGLQLVPLPASVIKVLSPGAFEIYSPLLEVLGKDKWIPLSIQPKETLHELMRLISYMLVYILTIQLLRNPERLKFTAQLVTFLGGGVAVFAIVQRLGSPDLMYWFRPVPQNASFFGPWVNANQFAGFIELLSPLALALFLFYKPRVTGDESLREKIVSFFTEPGVQRHLFFGLGSIMMVLAVFVSLCRGGILSLIFGAIVFLFLYNLKFPKRSRAAFIVILFCSIIAVSMFGWEKIASEFNKSFDSSGSFSDGRLTLWADSWRIIKDFPLFGAGFGSFLALYPLYKTMGDDLIYDHAHNDYLELLTDGGVIGFLLASWFIISLLRHGWVMIRARRDRFASLVGIGTISGLSALLAHSITDFNLHNGAVGFYFFFIAALLVSSVNCRFNYFSPGSLLKKLDKKSNSIFGLVGIVVIIVLPLIQIGSFIAAHHYKKIKDIYVNAQLQKGKLLDIEQRMNKAILTDPLEGLYSYKLGIARYYLGDKEQGMLHHISAALKNPLEGIFLQQIGLLNEDSQRSKFLVEEGYRRALHKDMLVKNYADYLFYKGRREEALEVLQERLEKNFREITHWLPLLYGNDVSIEEISTILPKKTQAWVFFARYCERNTSVEEANFFYRGALEYLAESGVVRPRWFHQIISFFKKHKEDDQALATVRKAVEILPGDPSFRIMLGDYYKDQGITYRAKEEYERALMLHPGNLKARSQLRKMGFGDSY